jgi:hypothetical protein
MTDPPMSAPAADGPPGVSAAIVARLDPAAIATRMIERFRTQIAGYQRLPSGVVHGQVLDVTRRNLELFVACVGAGARPEQAELEPFRASARDRASEGMPLEDLLHAYRLGGRLAWEEMTVQTRLEERGALPELAGLVMDYLDDVSSAVANSYLEERQHLVSEEERGLRILLDALCREPELGASARTLMERLRFPLVASYLPFAATLRRGGARAHSQLAARLRDRGLLAVTEGERVAGLAAHEQQGALEEHWGEHAVLVAGELLPRALLSTGLEEVRLAADLAQRAGRAGTVGVADLVPEMLLTRSPRLAGLLCSRTLGPLTGSVGGRSPDLVGTLRTLFAEGLNRRRAAASLHVHPNTLDYRLRRIEELTGLDLAMPRDIACLELSLVAQALEPDAAEPHVSDV